MRRLGRGEMSEAKSYEIESSYGNTIDAVPDAQTETMRSLGQPLGPVKERPKNVSKYNMLC
jgi:hypothetical protein